MRAIEPIHSDLLIGSGAASHQRDGADLPEYIINFIISSDKNAFAEIIAVCLAAQNLGRLAFAYRSQPKIFSGSSQREIIVI
jgi:hypothetical protein